MSVTLPITASKISINEIQNDSPTKYGSIVKGVATINRMRNLWKLVAMKTWKSEDRPDLDSSFSPASGRSPVVDSQTQLRCDFPYDLSGGVVVTVLVELFIPVTTTGFIEIKAEWDDGVDTAWVITGSYIETNVSEHYKLLTMAGIVYPRDNIVISAGTMDPKWLNIYTKTWTPDGGVVDTPQFSTLSVLLNPFATLTPDLNAGGSPFHTDLCIDIPAMSDDFNERSWIKMVDTVQNMITVLNHSPECSLDLIKNYDGASNPGYVQNVNDVYRTLGGDWAEVLMPVTVKQMDNKIRAYCSFYLVNTVDMTTILQSAPKGSSTWTNLDTLTGTTGWRQHLASVPVLSYDDFKFRVQIKRTAGTTNSAVAMYAYAMRYFYDDVLNQRA